MKFTENMLIKFNENKEVRLLYFEKLTKNVFVIDLFENRWPYIIAYDDLYMDVSELRAIIVEDNILDIAKKIDLTIAEAEKIDFAWEVISYIFKNINEPKIFYSRYRTPVIKETSERFKISFNTIKNYLLKYWKGGKIKNSLLPNYRNCGGRGKERKTSEVKRGRPRQYDKNLGVNIDNNMKKIFKAGLNKYYYNNRQNSLKTAYELTIRDYFIKDYVVKDNKKIPVLEDKSKIPTYNQFYYWYRKFNDEKREISQRYGERVFYQNYRPIVGNATTDGDLGPSTLYQIDSTIADVYLVSSLDRNLIIGRPVLYLVIDVYSRMIVGVNVTLESFNSYIGAMMALINAMTSKVNYCKKFGIEIKEDDWPISCVPQRILADRGELIGPQIENAIKNLGITIQNSPPYRADYKGIIEQSFRGMNLKLKPFVDGAVIDGKNTRRRGERDYRLDANLTLKEFTKIIIKCILFHNNCHVLSNYVTSEMMFEANIEKIPIKIWNYGVKNMRGMLREMPDEIIKINLLPQAEASVTPKGVLFNKLLYASDYALKEGWFQRARSNGNWKITVSYDPRDLTNIYFLEDDGKGFKKLTLLDYLSKYKEVERAELDEIFKNEKELEKKSKDNELQKKIMLFDEIEEIVEKARIAANIDKDITISKTQRLKGIDKNKKREKELNSEAIVLEEKIEKKHEENIDNNFEVKNQDRLDLFWRIQEESRGE